MYSIKFKTIKYLVKKYDLSNTKILNKNEFINKILSYLNNSDYIIYNNINNRYIQDLSYLVNDMYMLTSNIMTTRIKNNSTIKEYILPIIISEIETDITIFNNYIDVFINNKVCNKNININDNKNTNKNIFYNFRLLNNNYISEKNKYVNNTSYKILLIFPININIDIKTYDINDLII